MKKISLIIPCYNEEESIPLFYRETTNVLKKLEEYSYEMVFVNDGSTDNTLDVLTGLAEMDDHVKYLHFSRNFGKEAAMYAGFCNVSAENDYCGRPRFVKAIKPSE